MPRNLSVSELEHTPFIVEKIQRGMPNLKRKLDKFEATIFGRCSLAFASGVALSFAWQATVQAGNGDLSFELSPRIEMQPAFEGALLVDAVGTPLSWSEQNSSLFHLIDELGWQNPIITELASVTRLGGEL